MACECYSTENVSYDNNYGWKIQFDHEFKEKRNQNFKPRFKQWPQFVAFLFRYAWWYMKIRLQKIKPFIDGIKVLGLQQIYGVPLGGIGAGTIGRGYRGEFCRFQLVPGLYKHRVVDANQFIVRLKKHNETVYQQVLSPLNPKKHLQSWKWGFDPSNAKYRGLYPRAWYTYSIPEHGIELTCRQVSPVIPHNYKDSSLPVGAFIWTVQNKNAEPVEVSIAFTFKNGTGGRSDKVGGCWTEPFVANCEGYNCRGMYLHQKLRNMGCTLALAGLQEDGVEVSHLVSFDPAGTGSTLWQDLWENGCLNSGTDVSAPTLDGQEIGCAICCRTTVNSNSERDMKMCLVWDMPKIHFRTELEIHKRWYTRWFNAEETSAGNICAYSFANLDSWEKQIKEWQNTILDDLQLPSWYKSALFNELYFISDGGTVWVEMPPAAEGTSVLPGDVRYDYGRFVYLEGHEYRMFNTYDVHFYASFSLIMLWPKLQLSVQYDMRDATIMEDKKLVKYLMSGTVAIRKTSNSVPHDVGDPEGEPWIGVNAYFIHDTANWKDLNLKFVLQVYRDYVFTHDENYLKNMWPVIKTLMDKCLTWDVDNDGLIENSGFADQTYDSWIMFGSSAYCGGLWLSALHVCTIMASKMNEEGEEKKYLELLQKGQKAFHDKLWTGSYYKFDSSERQHSSSIMSDQLCGHWYLKACGITAEVFPKENVHKALQTIFDNNVLKFKNGSMGAVNGMMPNGKVDITTIQSEEMWIGVTYSLAATMIHEGMKEEGFTTARGAYCSVYDKLGMAFQTPEALFGERHYRSLGYMRPLSIWAIQWALQKTKDQHGA